MPKVSVIVPVRNVENYLPTCLNSLTSQTLSDIEIILINEASSDNSQAIVDGYKARFGDKIVSYNIENPENTNTLDFGAEKATGEYIGFVNGFDCVSHNMFEILYNKAVSDDSDMVVCNFGSIKAGKVSCKKTVKKIELFPNSVKKCPDILLYCTPIIWNKLYKRDWYNSCKISFGCNSLFEKCVNVYKLAYLANKISAVSEFLCFHRNKTSKKYRNPASEASFDVFAACDNIRSFFGENNASAKVTTAIERICQLLIFKKYKYILKNKSLFAKMGFYGKARKYLKQNLPNWQKNKYFIEAKKKGRHIRLFDSPLSTFAYASYISAKRTLKSILKPIRHRYVRKKNLYINNTRFRELQLLELDILKDINEICKANNITFYLSNHALLGAIRHKGFIPWNSSLSIAMPRDDYNRFLQIAPESLNKDYFLLNETVNSAYPYLYSRVVSRDDHGFINMHTNLPLNCRGPYVDIQPLDYLKVKNDRIKYRKIRILSQKLLIKTRAKRPNRLTMKIYGVLCSGNCKRIRKSINKELTQYGADSKYICNFSCNYKVPKQTVKQKVYGEPKMAEFEGLRLPVPHDYDKLLTQIFDDYMPIPSIENRKIKNGFFDATSFSTMATTREAELDEFTKEALTQIRDLQLYGLEILKAVDKVCKKHNITYYLGEGTLLGAVRHHGFIPWDDDIDIVMPREDLKKFMQICDDELAPDYKLQFYHNIERYWVQSPKVRMLRKTEFEQPKLLKYTEDVGPYIDIFPLDYAPKSYRRLVRQEKSIKTYRRILFLRNGFSRPKNILQKFYKLYSKLFTVRQIHKIIERKATRYNNGERKVICNFGSYYHISKESFPVETFGKPVYIQFEDTEFPVPCDYRYVLTKTYGDYMQLPPKEKQIAHHHFR